MAQCRKGKVNKKSKEDGGLPLNLRLEDAGCPICLEILIEPITMPCKHRMCKPCFVKNIEITNLHCPFCKKRIGTWARRAKDVNTLIDQRLWDHLKERFPETVNARLQGRTNDELPDESLFAVEFSHRIAESGQIGEEFKSQVEEMEREQRELEHRRDLKSKALIVKIQQEELRGKENLPKEDDDSSSPSSSPDLLQPKTFISPRSPINPNVISDIEETPALTTGQDINIDQTFMELQRRAEERIQQSKSDEEYARKLQEEETTPITTRRMTPKRGKGPRQLTLEEAMRIKRRRIE